MTGVQEHEQAMRDALVKTVLQRIREIRPDIGALEMLMLGPDAVEPLLERWNAFERSVMAAKLAIIRDEFAARFPDYENETESFSFGINDTKSNRYMDFLVSRETNDIFILASEVIHDSFGQFHFDGKSHLIVKLTNILQNYSRETEALFQPYAEKFGRTA